MKKAFVLLCVCQPFVSTSQSISSCGAASDHLKDVKIALTPDPAQKGKPWTITLSGNLDAALAGGNVDVDLQVKALGVIDQPVKTSSPFTLSPGIAAGSQSLSIGPLSLPDDLPGSVEVDGTVKISNDKSEPVACVKLALNVPALSSIEQTPSSEASGNSPHVQGVTNCGKSSDHLKNVAESTSGGVTTITGTFDELIAKMSVNLDLKVKVTIFSHTVKMQIPISYTPGVPKGDFKITSGPPKNLRSDDPYGLVGVTGTVTFDDGQSQEIACLDIASSAANETAVVVV